MSDKPDDPAREHGVDADACKENRIIGPDDAELEGIAGGTKIPVSTHDSCVFTWHR